MENLQSKLFSLTTSDFVRSAWTAVSVAVIGAIARIVLATGFDVFATDWKAAGMMFVNVAIVAFVGDLARRFMTDSNGAVFGKFGGRK